MWTNCKHWWCKKSFKNFLINNINSQELWSRTEIDCFAIRTRSWWPSNKLINIWILIKMALNSFAFWTLQIILHRNGYWMHRTEIIWIFHMEALQIHCITRFSNQIAYRMESNWKYMDFQLNFRINNRNGYQKWRCYR